MSNRLSQFWQELKRRKVLRVITVYAAVSFVILQLIEILAPSLRLPEWTMNFILVVLIVGFVIAIILSWIYDIHPEGGIVKTEPVHKVKETEIPKSSKSWKIASYISFVVIVGLIVLNIFGWNQGARIDENLKKSIAVLPFYNLSGDVEQEYICDGLTDEIISHLFKVSSFDKVVSFTSVKLFKDPDRNISKIAVELDVNYILEGSYKKMGDMFKITAQLIEPKSDNHIWLDDYELPYNDIMGIPGEIALQIANHLNAFISEDLQQSIDRKSTDNEEAYKIGQRIVSLYNKALGEYNPTYYEQITKLAKEAIDLDPDYALAYSFLGTMKMFDGLHFGNKEILSVVWDAERYYMKAKELDPYDLRGNTGLAWMNYWVKWDYTALEDFKLRFPNALASEVNYITGYIMYETQMGHFEEAVSIPESDSFEDNLVKAYILLGNEEKARKLLRSAAVEQRYYPLVGELYIWLHEFDSALYYLESALISESPLINIPRYQADLALACHKMNQNERARDIIGRLTERSDTTSAGSPAYFIGWYYSRTGNPDSAFYWLEEAVENRSPEFPWLKVDPAFNSLKDDPRYWDLYERTGHKAYDDYIAGKGE